MRITCRVVRNRSIQLVVLYQKGTNCVRNILKIFFEAEVNSWGVLVALVLASIVEGFGWASVVPLLSSWR